MHRLLCGLLLAGCGTTGSDDIVGPFTGDTHRYTVDWIRLPMTNSECLEYGGNLDGEGPVDNVLGQTINSLLGGYGNVTSHADDMVAAGAIASSIEIVADDLENDPTVGVRFLGTPSSPWVMMGGRIEDGVFQSNLTAYSEALGEGELHLPIFADADPSLVAAIGMEMILQPDGSGGFEGTIHAGIPHDTAFLQAVHRGLTQMIASDPGGHRMLLRLLDGSPRDGKLSYVEVANNSLLVSFLAPDLEIGERRTLSFGFRAHFRPCPSGQCTEGLPLDHCFDRVLDGDESAIDCGGSCRPCEAGASCGVPDDCETAACEEGVCAAPSCTNGVRDGLESDVDCGEACSVRCDVGQRCYFDSDCASLECGLPCVGDDAWDCLGDGWGDYADTCHPWQPG